MAPPVTDAAATTTTTKQEQEQQPAAEGEGEGVEAGGDITLVAECGTEVRLSRAAARMSAFLLGMMEEGGCVADHRPVRVPVERADAGTLRLVAAYCERHSPHYDPVASAARLRDPFPPFPVDFEPAASSIKPVTQLDPDPHGLVAWDHKLITDLADNSALFSLIIVANFLAIEDLVDLGCTAVADKMRGKTPDEVRVALDIKNDYTPEQEAEVRRENAWAFED